MAKNEKKEKPITIWLTESQYLELQNYCYKYDLGISQVVRSAIRKFIERY